MKKKKWTHADALRSDPDGTDELDAKLVAACARIDELRRQLEWLWSNCRIVYYPPDKAYPIEHCRLADKDARAAIERAQG